MFARILEFVPLMEKKDEFIRVVKKEVLPIPPTPKLRAPSQLWRTKKYGGGLSASPTYSEYFSVTCPFQSDSKSAGYCWHHRPRSSSLSSCPPLLA